MGLYLELGVQLLSLNFRAFRGARGVFCPFLFSHLLGLERGFGGGFSQVSQIWVSLFLSSRFIASYLASLGELIS